MNTITDLIKECIRSQVDSLVMIDPDKRIQATEAIAEGAYNGILKAITSGKLAGLVSLLKNEESSGAKEVGKGIESELASTLLKQTGISEDTGKMISGVLMPFVLKLLRREVDRRGDGNLDVANLVGMFAGEKFTDIF